MNYVKQLGIICAVSFVGELLHKVLPFPIPASAYGLVIMLILLLTKIIKLEQVEKVSDYLISIMPIFFVPPAVSVITSTASLSGHVISLFLICEVTFLAIFAATGRGAQWVIRYKKRDKGLRMEKNE